MNTTILMILRWLYGQAWSTISGIKQPPRIGSPEPWTPLIAGFLDGLKEAAFVEAPHFD
jgi:hypothetical protein